MTVGELETLPCEACQMKNAYDLSYVIEPKTFVDILIFTAMLCDFSPLVESTQFL